jgi:hypothetical protein
VFGSGFEVDDGLTRFAAEEMIWSVQQSHLTNIVIVESVESSSGGAIVFRATDPVTALRHQIAWIATWSEGRLVRMTTTHMIIHGDEH